MISKLQLIALFASASAVAHCADITADFDSCFLTGGKIRGQFAIEGLDIPEPGDNFVVTAQTFLAGTSTPVDAVPAQIFNGAAVQGPQPSIIVGTQTPEVSRVAGFLDFNPAQGVTCNGSKINVDLKPQTYTENGNVVFDAAATGPVACPASAAPTTAATKLQQMITTAGKPATTAKGAATTAKGAATTAKGAATTAKGAATTANGAATTAKGAATTAKGAATTASVATTNGVTVSYAGQCSNGLTDHIQLSVTISKDGEAFKPDAAGFGVPCDEYFELSFSFVDANGQKVNLPIQANQFFNAKRLLSDGAGNVIAQLSPEINGFGSGFMQLGNGLQCVNGQPNFKIRTNYLLTALNDGTYNRQLNTVTDAGFFGSGLQSTTPANANQLGLGQPQCNTKTNTPITFPFPAAPLGAQAAPAVPVTTAAPKVAVTTAAPAVPVTTKALTVQPAQANVATAPPANAVTVTYAGSCNQGQNAIQLTVSSSKDGAPFKPDAGDGKQVPCDEYFELSFAFVDANGNAVNFNPQANSFFNTKQFAKDAQGNIIVQFIPENAGFGSGFLPLSNGLQCVNGQPNFKIRTNYLLTALNDGTYNRQLNTVTDAGFFGSGQKSTPPANANQLGLGQAQCNLQTKSPITFPFPAATSTTTVSATKPPAITAATTAKVAATTAKVAATTAKVAATTAKVAATTAKVAATTAKGAATTPVAAPTAAPSGVTVTYSGQCTNGLSDHISFVVSLAKGGTTFQPDAAGFGVPCDEYFELSFSFLDANGQKVNFPLQTNQFFNAGQLVTDGKGNVIVRLPNEISSFGAGFLPLTNGLQCNNGQPNFKVRTNYLLTALNDGTYNRQLNTVTDAGFYSTGQQSSVPANANQLQLGKPMCNVQAGTPITFPFPAA